MPRRTKRLISALLKPRKKSRESEYSDDLSENNQSSSEGDTPNENSDDQASTHDGSSDAGFTSASDASSSDSDASDIDKTSCYGELPENLAVLGVNVFELKERDPDTMFALSYDVALKIGLRDSSSLFNRFPQLQRLWTTEKEREYLVSIQALSANVMRKNIGIVDVRQLVGVVGLESLCSLMNVTETRRYFKDDESGPKPKRWSKQLQQAGDAAQVSYEELLQVAKQKLNPSELEQLKSSEFMDEDALASLIEAASFNKRRFIPNAKATKPAYFSQLTNGERGALNQILTDSTSSLFKAFEPKIHYTNFENNPYPLALMRGRRGDNVASTESASKAQARMYIQRAKAGIPLIKT